MYSSNRRLTQSQDFLNGGLPAPIRPWEVPGHEWHTALGFKQRHTGDYNFGIEQTILSPGWCWGYESHWKPLWSSNILLGTCNGSPHITCIIQWYTSRLVKGMGYLQHLETVAQVLTEGAWNHMEGTHLQHPETKNEQIRVSETLCQLRAL